MLKISEIFNQYEKKNKKILLEKKMLLQKKMNINWVVARNSDSAGAEQLDKRKVERKTTFNLINCKNTAI